METLIIRPKNEDEAIAIKAVVKVLKIDFETEEGSCNPEFVEKVVEGVNARKSYKPGQIINVNMMWK